MFSQVLGIKMWTTLWGHYSYYYEGFILILSTLVAPAEAFVLVYTLAGHVCCEHLGDVINGSILTSLDSCLRRKT